MTDSLAEILKEIRVTDNKEDDVNDLTYMKIYDLMFTMMYELANSYLTDQLLSFKIGNAKLLTQKLDESLDDKMFGARKIFLSNLASIPKLRGNPLDLARDCAWAFEICIQSLLNLSRETAREEIAPFQMLREEVVGVIDNHIPFAHKGVAWLSYRYDHTLAREKPAPLLSNSMFKTPDVVDMPMEHLSSLVASAK